MPKQITQKPTIVFNKGLITEAGELTFPEGASVDELNMDLQRDGSRKRRLGVSYESSYSLGPSHTEGDVTAVSTWENAGGVAGLTFVVVQIAGTLHFYVETEGALSDNKKSFTVNLSTYNRPTGFGASTVAVQTTVIEGILVVASSEINTIKVTYNDATDSITTEEIQFKVRDFEFLGDINSYTGGDVYSVTRHYDTLNAGWNGSGGSVALNAYIATSGGFYPALNLPWYAAKDSNGNFDYTDFTRIHAGSSVIANGSYILDLYNQDRNTAASLGTSAYNYIETSRFKTVAAFAGRVFYAGMSNKNSNKVYFSKLLYQTERLGDCYQQNDPTAETFSDLLSTDGGVISVQGAYNIQKLHVLGPYLVILAENGVWTVNGVDNVFRATEYAVNKITEVGLTYTRSFVSAQGRPYWWSDAGIHTLSFSADGTLSEVNISIGTIQTFWGEIEGDKKSQVKSSYDAFNQRVVWCYPSNSENTDNKLNRFLFFDESLKAFFPWEVSDAVSTQYVLEPFYLKGSQTNEIIFDVVDSNGNLVVDSNGDQVTVTRSSRNYTSSELTLLVRDSSGQVTFANFTGSGFLDWGDEDYESFAESGYDFSGDLLLKKTIIYVTPYFKVTEEEVSGNDTIGYQFTRPSSCLMSSYWDFKTSISGVAQQAYRLKKLATPTTSGPFDYPFEVTTSRLRMRGRGRSMRLRFQSEEGKDFHLLGFDVVVGRNPK